MVESFLFNIAESVLSQIASLALAEISLARGVKDDLRKLHNTLSNVKAVILDAEEQQLRSHEVATWLGQLKNLLFDAEDVFDEFAYEALHKQVVNARGGINKKVSRYFSSSNPIAFRLKMGHKVKEIREAFDEVAANKAKFHLNTHLVPSNNSPLVLNEREMTHSFVHTSEIIGREKDREIIVESLTDSSDGGPDESLSIVSIIGFGGLGKTALAKMIFNDTRVVDHFEKRVWVCLGDLNEFNVNQVMVKIVKSVTGEKSVDSDPEQLQSFLRESLQNKRFLLVLDDVWVVNRSKWLELKRLILSSVNGSKVVVTTRNLSVASCMESSLAHNLEGLSHNECVSLFKTFAFNGGEDNQNLMKIGDDIVRKCKGVPLAVKTLGCLMFSKRDMSDWIHVRGSEMWQLEQNKDDILSALKISYNHLPFVLKQCFLYCSVFPKDFEFNNVELIHHWLANGLLRSSVKNRTVEDIGQQYINELYVRGFFQDLEHLSTMRIFKMHDLVHDLALSVTQEEFRNANVSAQDEFFCKSIRYVSFSSREGLVGERVPKSFLKNKSSHSLVMPTIWSMCLNGEGATSELVESFLSKLKYVRILVLSNTNLEELSSSIGNLKHLRYLDLQGCRRLKRLPNSICKLYHLQTLLLSGCEELEELPEDIGDLVNLRSLLLTTKQKHLSLAAGNGIKSLRSLQILVFYCCECIEYLLESDPDYDDEANKLASIRTLMVNNCQSLISLFPRSSTNSSIRHQTALESLVVVDCPSLSLASICNGQIKLSRLRSLFIGVLPQMESLPEWILEECASTLEFLRIDECPNLTTLPEWLHNLTSLQKLEIIDCPKLMCMPEGMQGLTSLRELKIQDCPELSRRCKQGVGEDWPNIKHILKIDLLENQDQDDL